MLHCISWWNNLGWYLRLSKRLVHDHENSTAKRYEHNTVGRWATNKSKDFAGDDYDTGGNSGNSGCQNGSKKREKQY